MALPFPVACNLAVRFQEGHLKSGDEALHLIPVGRARSLYSFGIPGAVILLVLHGKV